MTVYTLKVCVLLSQIPFNLEKMSKDKVDKEILRAGIIAELDAINPYEQMATLAQDPFDKGDTFGHCQRRKSTCR